MKLSSLPSSRCLYLLGISSNIYQVKQIHAQIIANSLSSSDLNLAKLISAYFAVGNGYDQAKLIYKHANNKLTCTHVLRSCAIFAAMAEGKQTHARAIKTGLSSDVAVATSAIFFYSNCRDLPSAQKLFVEMPEKNSVTWNTMLTAYCTNSLATKALILFRDMRGNDLEVTERTAVSLVSACSQVGDLRVGSSIHGVVYKSVHLDCFIGTVLIDMYSKCGSLEFALNMFDEMRVRNVLTWTTMVSGLAMHGKGRDALDLMDKMEREGVRPNAVTFTCLLSACCHAGLLEEGVRVFREMKGRFGVEPGVQHYGCLVDLLGRAGMVEAAMEVVGGMQVEPDSVVWRALLSACKVHGRVELGEEIGKRLMKLGERRTSEDKSCEDFVALSNVYATASRWEDAWRVRDAMRGAGLQNKVGCSAVQNL